MKQVRVSKKEVLEARDARNALPKLGRHLEEWVAAEVDLRVGY